MKSCSKIAQKGKSCLKLLEPKKAPNAPNAKSCSKVAEHNRDMPTHISCPPLVLTVGVVMSDENDVNSVVCLTRMFMGMQFIVAFVLE